MPEITHRKTAVSPYVRAKRPKAPSRAHPLLPLVWGALGVFLPLYWFIAMVWFTEAVF